LFSGYPSHVHTNYNYHYNKQHSMTPKTHRRKYKSKAKTKKSRKQKKKNITPPGYRNKVCDQQPQARVKKESNQTITTTMYNMITIRAIPNRQHLQVDEKGDESRANTVYLGYYCCCHCGPDYSAR